MKRTITITLSTLALSVTSLVGTGPTAQAGPVSAKSSDCLPTLCLYEHDNYKGRRAVVEPPWDWTKTCIDLTKFSFRATASSMKNDGPATMRLYSTRNCTTPKGHKKTYFVKKYSSDKDFTNNGFDNKARSVRYYYAR